MADLALPDFIVIGTMKSATSSLYWWLADQPECFLAFPKETDFFSSERRWQRGLDWYACQFSGASDHQLLGEASVSYTSPRFSSASAERMAGVVPDARLVFLIRHPIDRLRSHYRHEVQRSRESRPLSEAVSEPGNAYVGHSLYYSCLEPYLKSFPREQICVVRFDDLVQPPHAGWAMVLRHVGVSDRPAPGMAYNRAGDHVRWTPAMRFLKDNGILRFSHVARLPRPVRRIGRRVLMRTGPAFESELDGSRADIPDSITGGIWEDLARLEAWLLSEEPLWPASSSAAPSLRDR